MSATSVTTPSPKYMTRHPEYDIGTGTSSDAEMPLLMTASVPGFTTDSIFTMRSTMTLFICQVDSTLVDQHGGDTNQRSRTCQQPRKIYKKKKLQAQYAKQVHTNTGTPSSPVSGRQRAHIRR